MAEVSERRTKHHLNKKVKYGQFTPPELLAIFIFTMAFILILELPLGLIGLVLAAIGSVIKKRHEKKKAKENQASDFFRDMSARVSHKKKIEDSRGMLKFLTDKK